MNIEGNVSAEQTIKGTLKDIPFLDKTLTKEGYSADSKAVGDALNKKAVGKAYISNNTDLNTVTESGMYRLGGSLVNAPSGASYGQLLVIHGGGDSIAQQVFDFTMARMWLRTGAPADVGGAGTWTDWVQCYTTAKKPTASDVGARPNTWLPSLSDIGAAPASHVTDENNPHGITPAQIGAATVDFAQRLTVKGELTEPYMLNGTCTYGGYRQVDNLVFVHMQITLPENYNWYLAMLPIPEFSMQALSAMTAEGEFYPAYVSILNTNGYLVIPKAVPGTSVIVTGFYYAQ